MMGVRIKDRNQSRNSIGFVSFHPLGILPWNVRGRSVISTHSKQISISPCSFINTRSKLFDKNKCQHSFRSSNSSRKRSLFLTMIDMQNADYQNRLVECAKKMADAAGVIVRDYFRRPIPLDVDIKSDDSPVTIADRLAEESMRQILSKEFPDHEIVGEELGGLEKARNSKFSWVLDPIDGTKAFISGKPTFGILIAFLYNGKPILGVIDQPISNERWIGTKWNNTTIFNNTKVIHTSHYTSEYLKECYVHSTTPDMFEGQLQAKYLQLLKHTRPAVYGADCYAYALLASGFVHLVVEADMKPWDYLALVPIVECAGGCISDWNGNPLSLDSNGTVLAAASQSLHEAAQQFLKLETHD
mmetsp:Transcript_5678/g.9998  ORF Transcript_5678/g.9998 Transcript_5678/m.9998 type:complete len:358 (-) Transcript_5678:10-1083(-)